MSRSAPRGGPSRRHPPRPARRRQHWPLHRRRDRLRAVPHRLGVAARPTPTTPPASHTCPPRLHRHRAGPVAASLALSCWSRRASGTGGRGICWPRAILAAILSLAVVHLLPGQPSIRAADTGVGAKALTYTWIAAKASLHTPVSWRPLPTAGSGQRRLCLHPGRGKGASAYTRVAAKAPLPTPGSGQRRLCPHWDLEPGQRPASVLWAPAGRHGGITVALAGGTGERGRDGRAREGRESAGGTGERGRNGRAREGRESAAGVREDGSTRVTGGERWRRAGGHWEAAWLHGGDSGTTAAAEFRRPPGRLA